MTPDELKVLIVDDDPSHLEIYSMLVKQAGIKSITALVEFKGVDFPRDESVGLVVLDYRLNSLKTSAELAQEIRQIYPLAPIVVLSDLWSLPTDMEPYVDAFVRKGEPLKLIPDHLTPGSIQWRIILLDLDRYIRRATNFSFSGV